MEELEEAKQQAQAATHAFNAVRQERFDAFMSAFTHISNVIDRIFKVAVRPALLPVAIPVLPLRKSLSDLPPQLRISVCICK